MFSRTKSNISTEVSTLFSGNTQITIEGSNTIFLENYIGIIEYSESNITVQCKGFLLYLAGTRFVITQFDRYAMSIQGEIQSIEYRRN